MSFFNFGDSPDRSAADTSFAFSFSKNEDIADEDEVVLLKKTNVDKHSPEKVQAIVNHHEGTSSGVVDTRGTKDDTNDEVTTKEDNQHNVDLTEIMKDCMDDISREFSTFLPALQAHKVNCKSK